MKLAAVVCACLLVLAASPAFAQDAQVAPELPAIELGAPFTSHAVLQRQMPVPVWGWADPGTRVTVAFADQTKTATADEDGKWMLRLNAMAASAEPRSMRITTSDNKEVVLEDILIGEVWVASGQSNMQWEASKCDVGRVLQRQIAERVEAGTEQPPIIREAKITSVYSAMHPIEHATAQWSSEQGEFSAIAFAFAYQLHRELGVPIGILNCSFSSTAIEAWTPREGFAAGTDAYTQSVYQRILETDPATPQHRAAWDAYYQHIEDGIAANDQRILSGQPAEAIDLNPPGNTSGNRDASWLYNARMHPMVPYAIRGAIWNQGYANMGGGLDYYANLHSLVRGWRMMWDNPELPVYFHQFYSSSVGGPEDANHPTLDSTAEMRLGTWLARDIPNTGMASQIDITGAIHYYSKTLPGQRLALHALRNQYGRDIVVDGPMFNSYTVAGNRLIVSFDHADGGLVVGETGTNQTNNFAIPTLIEDGASQVTLFYIADENRVWHPATLQIDGERAVLTAPGVDHPRGVSYGTNGVGNLPNLYNTAMLPMTPFTFYDNEMVLSETWPDEQLQIAGYTPDASQAGLLYEYRKMPILSAQFRDNAVLQHGVPVTIWGSAIHDWGYEAQGQAVIHFSFGNIERTIPVTPGMREWSVTLPAMEPTSEPRTLRVSLTIDGELAHERVAEGIVIGDVWYVAMPALEGDVPIVEATSGIVRVMERRAKRDSFPRPSRFSVCVSTTPENRFACTWEDAVATELAGAVALHIAANAGGIPVGVIFMQNSAGRDESNPPLSAWMPFASLASAPSLAEDYELLGAMYPGSPSYDANLRQYVAGWQAYWSEYIPQMIEQGRVPDGAPWGQMPSAAVSSRATQTTQVYNTMVHCFTPAALRGVMFITSPAMGEATEPSVFREQFAALGSSWLTRFGGEPALIYTVPDEAMMLPAEGAGSIDGDVTGVYLPLPIAEGQNKPVLSEAVLDTVYEAARLEYQGN